jgi:transcriptional regulator with GAF, ATPase, and Fis domain
VWDITQERQAKEQREELLAEVTKLKDELEQERDYLRHELIVNSEFGEIVGDSAATRQVLAKIEAVAVTDASVLIQGDSGVGKELVASAIHEKSNRRGGPLIKVNCASIPTDLFESEFFGHVKGAFSGAVRDRVGRFQAADGGTLFLDEVGEIPLKLQSKLLRVLQEGEFERVGEDVSRKVDVRVIAATNRDLDKEAKEGRFRTDLFFRLSVFPLAVPTLTERKEDIIPLAMHFIDRCTRRIGREPFELTRKQAEVLESHPWPGNIRELQHVIERAVILSTGERLRLDLAFKDPASTPLDSATIDKPDDMEFLTDVEIKDFERRNIIAVLDATNWTISGTDGAAARLGLKPSTLTSRMKVMKIQKPDRSKA